MKSISSRQNAWFKRIRAAIASHDDEIVLEGPKQVADALAKGWKPIVVVNRGESGLALGDVRGTGAGQTLSFSNEIFDALAETRAPQNVMALFPRPVSSLDDVLARRDSIAVALDNVQDPGNVGTIIRLAAAFDASGIILLPGCADAWSPKAIRASVGAVLNVPVTEGTADQLIASGRKLFATDAEGTNDVPPSRDAVLVFDNEGMGVSNELRAAATPIAIRMSGAVESLNVAGSAAILLSRSFEARNR